MPPRSEALRAHLALALPLCVAQVGHQLMSATDTAFLGHYNEVALAGSGVGGTFFFAIFVLGAGIVMGLDTLIPQALGAGDQDRAKALMRSGFRLALVVGVPVTALTALGPLLFWLASVQEDVAAEATLYLYGRMPGLLPTLVFTVQRSYLQARGLTKPIVLAMVVGNLVNVLADALLIFGDRTLEKLGLPTIGLPALGAFGAGIASSIVSFASIGIAELAIRSDGVRRASKASMEHVRATFRLGLPVAGHLLAEVGIFALVGILAGRLGAQAAASHQVALLLASLSFSVALGMASATSVRVGSAVGAGDHHGARSAGLIGIGLGTAIMGAAGIAFFTIPRTLAGIFTDDPDIVEAAIPLLRIAALFQLSDAIQAIGAGALRGLGDNRWTFLANVVGHYGIGLWIATGLAFWAAMGAVGLWWGLSAGLSAVAIALLLRFLKITGRPITLQ